jgi:hypothetical protein
MTTAQLAPTPVFKAFDNNGNPLAGGLLYSYIAGTTTPQATYPSSSEVTPNTNPIVLNSRGECALWLDPTLSYKLNLTDASGNQIPGWPVDNVQGFSVMLGTYLPTALTQAIIGGVLYPQTTQEKTAGVTPTYYWYASGNVLRYGADPTGTTDSTTAFQSAINSVSYIVSPTTQAQCQVQGGEVYIPRGIYIVSSTLYLNSNVHLVGEDCGPIQQAFVVTAAGSTPQCAMIYYKSSTQQSIAIDASGFWLVNQTAYNGTASAGGASTITISTGLTVNYGYITITGGTGSGQVRPINSYVSGSGVLTVSWPWTTQPTNTSTWSITGITAGTRMTELISVGENAMETSNYGSYSQGVGVKNIALVASNSQYMGIRYNVAPQGVIENCLIYDFQVSIENTGSAYSKFQNIVSAAQFVGFGWVSGDHTTRINCMDFAVAATAAPMTSSNRPWFVDWMANEGTDITPTYWCAHYIADYDAGGCFITCDGEGGDRSYFVSGPIGTTFIGCHMEDFTHYGFYQNGGNATWIGGDWYISTTAPAFSGISCRLNVTGIQPDSGISGSAITFGSFPNTYGGAVNVHGVPSLGGDTRPTSGSLVTWDAFPPSISTTTISTVGAGTLTAAGLYSGIILRGGSQSGNFNDTTDTATNILAQFIPPPVVGSSFQCEIQNTTGHTETILAGSGVTLVGNLSLVATIATETSRVLTIIVTNVSSPAVNITG